LWLGNALTARLEAGGYGPTIKGSAVGRELAHLSLEFLNLGLLSFDCFDQ